MSVITEAYAVPSRIIGVYRYFNARKGRRESIESVVSLLAPESLRTAETDSDREGGGREMARRTVKEAVDMGLLSENDGQIELAPAIEELKMKPLVAESLLPKTLSDLFFDVSRNANHDLGRQIAWYLGQDAFNAPGNWKQVEETVSKQFPSDRLGLTNSTPYGNFEDWACFLGFSWTHVFAGKEILTPDPTAHLRLRLPELLPGKPNTRHTISDVMNRLARVCPVFEEGFLRKEIELVLPRERGHLSTTTSLGFLRLRDEGVIELISESDATKLLLPDGDRVEPVSHVILLRDN